MKRPVCACAALGSINASARLSCCGALLILVVLAASTANAGLLALYTFEGNAYDVSGRGRQGRHGVVHGAVPTAAGYEGQAYDFNGFSHFIEIPVDINPAALPKLTMGGWARGESLGVRAIISHDDGGYDRNLNIDYRGGGGAYRYSAFTGYGVTSAGPPSFPFGEWVFLAVRYDDAAQQLTLDVGTDRTTAVAYPGQGYGFTRIGSNPGFGEYFDGQIDNVFFFDEVLSDARIDEIRLGGVGAILPEPSGLALLVSTLPLTLLIATISRRTFTRD
jgi:hypothetical protein